MKMFVKPSHIYLYRDNVDFRITAWALLLKLKWMFNDNHCGAIAITKLYSIIKTAKANNLEPTSYITRCLEELCKSEPDIDMLLPWNFKG